MQGSQSIVVGGTGGTATLQRTGGTTYVNASAASETLTLGSGLTFSGYGGFYDYYGTGGQHQDLGTHDRMGFDHRAARQEQCSFVEGGVVARTQPAHADQRGRHRRGAQDVDPQQGQSRFPDPCIEAHDRASISDALGARHQGIELFVEPERAGRAHRQFGRPVDPAHRAVERGER